MFAGARWTRKFVHMNSTYMNLNDMSTLSGCGSVTFSVSRHGCSAAPKKQRKPCAAFCPVKLG